MDQGLFYIFYPDDDGKPIWKCQIIKQIPFAIATEQGFETVRKYMLNLMKYASDGLRQLKDDSSKALKQGLTPNACDPEKWSVQPEETSDTIRNQGTDLNL